MHSWGGGPHVQATWTLQNIRGHCFKSIGRSQEEKKKERKKQRRKIYGLMVHGGRKWENCMYITDIFFLLVFGVFILAAIYLLKMYIKQKK